MKSRSRFALSRRTLLRGSLGIGIASVGLPLLEAMLNENGTALAGGAALPQQLITWFMGNGFRLDRLEPTEAGSAFTLSEELLPFANVEEYLKVVTGLQNWCYAQPTHHEGLTAFSGYNMTELSGLFSKSGGPTIDQVIAQHISDTAATPPIIRSIQAGVSRHLSQVDTGTTMSAISHRSTNEPLFPEFNPQQVWQALFGEFVPKPDDRDRRLSIVDAVREDAKSLRTRLGKLDQERVEAHLDGLNELETALNTVLPACSAPPKPNETNPESTQDAQLVSVNKVMSDLIVHAMKCDLTRVASVLFLGGASEAAFTEIGQSTSHHASTHQTDVDSQNRVHDVVVFGMQQAAYLAEKMKAEVDPTGNNLLDSGCIMLSSDCSWGANHSVSRQPYILIGNVRGRLTGKYHHRAIAYSDIGNAGGGEGTYLAAGNTSDVLYTLLKAYKPDATSVGDMTPVQLGGHWYGTTNPPSSMAPGSNTLIDSILGPAFG